MAGALAPVPFQWGFKLMKIKMLTSMAGATFSLVAGDVTERFPEGEAARLIDAGLAEPFKASASVEALNDLETGRLELSDRIEMLGTAVDGVGDDVSDLRSKVNALEKALAAAGDEISGLRAKADEATALKDVLKALTDEVTAFSVRVAAVESASVAVPADEAGSVSAKAGKKAAS